MKDLYFAGKDDEICYPISYWKWLMEYEGWDELTLYKAQPQAADNNFFWCKHYENVCEKAEGGCGQECEGYKARNGKKGCCIHYSLKFYEASDEIRLIKKKELTLCD